MCQFVSGIIKHKHKGVWLDVDLDSHTDIMEKFKIKDEKTLPPWLKFEYRPEDGNIFNHDRANWKFHIDDDHSQDSIPDWFDAAKAEEQAWGCLQKVIAARFLVGVKDSRTISEGRWFIKDSQINMAGNAKADLRGTSRVGVMRGTSRVEKQKDRSMTIRDMKIIVVDKRFTIEYLEDK